ncbi:hypothetical protein XELAEV_18047446mg [Xenopus laevis]|uniref:Protein NATD1 n=1 Tax=Xenopus laevis TaxID=8355 RepID=A0A974BUX6_XENLA|nr:hypothetical protein XELAEV_18047446mg [Xenopus laevis]
MIANRIRSAAIGWLRHMTSQLIYWPYLGIPELHMAHSVPESMDPSGLIRVEHDRKRRQFSVRLNGCHDRAVLLYEYVGKKTVDLQHTEVPDAFRGRGIAKHLAKVCAGVCILQKTHLCMRLYPFWVLNYSVFNPICMSLLPIVIYKYCA